MWMSARNERSTTTAKKMSAPTKRAVRYLKETWRRVVKAPQKSAYNFGTSMPLPPPPIRLTPASCINRTQLDDVVDDDEFTTIPSNVSYGVSSTCTSNLSPTIQDSDWRHFTDTGAISSPSTFLGGWSSPPTSPGRESRNEICSMDTIPFSIIDSAYFAGTNTGELDIADFYNSPSRPSTASGFRGPFSSSQISLATPTPAARPRPASDPAISSSTVADLEKLMEDIHMEDAPPPVPTLVCPPNSPAVDRLETEDKWSFVSVCGGSTTHGLPNDDNPDLPARKRRKISAMDSFISPSSLVEEEKLEQQQEEWCRRPRDHPRFSGVYTLDPNRRIVNFPHGPAVFMPPPPPSRTEG